MGRCAASREKRALPARKQRAEALRVLHAGHVPPGIRGGPERQLFGGGRGRCPEADRVRDRRRRGAMGRRPLRRGPRRGRRRSPSAISRGGLPSSASARASACATRGSSMGSGTSVRTPELAACARQAVREEVALVDPARRGEDDLAAPFGDGAIDVDVAERARVRRQQHVSDVFAGCRCDRAPDRPAKRDLAAAQVRGEVEIVDCRGSAAPRSRSAAMDRRAGDRLPTTCSGFEPGARAPAPRD